MVVSLAALFALTLLIWLASGVASIRATFNVPFLSSEPCAVMMLVLPLLACVAAFKRRANVRQISLHRG